MTTWVLLRGLAREARHWGRFPALLERQLPSGDAVLALDLPGNGALSRARSPWSIEGMAAAARRQRAERDARAPCVLVTLSLGGMVALEWAAQAPQEVEACILINTSAGGLSPPWQRMRPRRWPAGIRSLVPGRVDARERAIHAMTSARPADPAVLAQWVDYARSQPVTATNMLRQVVAAARFRGTRPPVPTLLLASHGDRLVSPECSRVMARAWQLALREHPWAGHDLPLDDPDWILEQVARWWPARSVRG